METVPSIDLYRELEVDPAATPETIEAAWRSLVKRHHPDVAGDRVAAIDKIKRLNLAHEWLSDRRLREMYDLTQLRRRHADVTFAEAPVRERLRRQRAAARSASGSYRVGPVTVAPSALVSAAVVAVLLVAAAGSVALYRAPESEALSGGPHSSQTAVAIASIAPAAAAAPPSRAVASQRAASPTVAVASRGEGPAYDADLPPDCAATGSPLEFTMPIDDSAARVIFVRCGSSRTFGPLAYVHDEGRWVLQSEGRFETAVVVQAFAGSMTGEPNEYSVVWSNDGGDTSWLVLYRFEEGNADAYWSSLDADRTWWLADFRYQPGVNNVRGAIIVRAAEPGSGTCLRCRDHDMNLESWEWSGEGSDARLELSWEKSDGIGP